jgi:hypothetical protein
MKRKTEHPVPRAPQGIGERNEKSLHAALKQWYAQPGDRFEERVDGFIVDLRRGDWCIEIQTSSLHAIKRKLQTLLEHHRVRLVYPIAREKWIVHLAGRSGKVTGRRKSPRRGQLLDLFDELVSIADLVAHDNLALDVVMIQEEQVQRADGKGSWRRRGQSIHDRRLLRVIETVSFETKEDFRRFLPGDLPQPFSNANLAACAAISIYTARKITYCFRKIGIIREAGKQGRQFLFETVRPEKVADKEKREH